MSTICKNTRRAHPFQNGKEVCICGSPGSFDPVYLIYFKAIRSSSLSPNFNIFFRIHFYFHSLFTAWFILLRNPGAWHIKVVLQIRPLLSSGKFYSSNCLNSNLTVFVGSLTLPSGLSLVLNICEWIIQNILYSCLPIGWTIHPCFFHLSTLTFSRCPTAFCLCPLLDQCYHVTLILLSRVSYLISLLFRPFCIDVCPSQIL